MVYALVFLLRLFGSLLVLKRPFWGMVLIIALDAVDFNIIGILNNLRSGDFEVNYPLYAQADKILDLYGAALAIWAGRLWSEKIAVRTLTVLFAVRAVGVGLFLFFNARIFLLFFPNLFEFFFLFYAYMMHYRPEFKIGTWPRLAAILFLLAIPKLGQELFLHYWHAEPLIRLKQYWHLPLGT